MNNADKHPVDKLFREHLHDAREASPPGGWERISGALAARKRRKALLWWRVAAAVALLALAFSAGYFWSGGDIGAPEMASSSGAEELQESSDAREKDISIMEDAVSPEEAGTAREKSSVPATAGELSDSPSNDISRNNEVSTPAYSSPENTAIEPAKERSMKVREGQWDNAAPDNLPERDYPLTMNRILAANLSGELSREVIKARAEHIALLANPYWMEDPNINEREEDASWKVAGSVAPMLAFRSTGSAYQDEALDVTNSWNNSTMEMGSEKPILAISGGIRSAMDIGTGWGLSLGLQYSRLGQETEGVQLPQNSYTTGGGPESFTAVTSAGEIEIENNEAQEMLGGQFTSSYAYTTNRLVQQFEYVEFPLLIGKRIINGNLSLEVDAGISTSFLVGNTTYFYESGQKRELNGTQGLRDVLLNGVSGLSLGIALGPEWGLAFRPGFRYAFTSINKDASFTYRPWSFSFGTGIYYSFR